MKAIEDYLATLDSDKRQQVESLRTIILSTQPDLREHIKWNAPSYVYDGEDRITFNLMNKQGVVKLVLHMGATRKEDKKGTPVLSDESGLIEWASDIRGMITFQSLHDITLHEASLRTILKNWLAIS